MNKVSKISKAQGALMGIAIGDALGMPVETMIHEEILKETKGLGITNFVNPLNRKDWSVGIKAGETTDDWQLTKAVAISIIRTQGQFDILDCANEHVCEFNRSTFGWGKTTRVAIQEVKEGIRIPGSYNPFLFSEGGGCGNGVIMKIAPLAIANASLLQSQEKLWNDVKALGELTHPDIRASVSAYAVAIIFREVFKNSMLEINNKKFLKRIIHAVEEVEDLENVDPEFLSDRLKKLFGVLDNPNKLRQTVGSGFFALDTAAFAIGTFLRHPTNFKAGILEAVNAGGDTDTNASIVGGLIGANVGINAIPEEWRNFNPQFKTSLYLGKMLCFK